jgi:hypothetical protein
MLKRFKFDVLAPFLLRYANYQVKRNLIKLVDLDGQVQLWPHTVNHFSFS